MSLIRKLAGLGALLVVIIGIPAFYYAFSWLTDRILALAPLPEAPLDAYLFLSALSVAVGLFWVFWAWSYLHFVGRGSPIEMILPTEQLVTTGPYAYTRNPMLLGLLFLLLATALYWRSVTALVLLPGAALAALEYIRANEEPILRERFGREYSQYRRVVPALIPRRRR